MLISRRRREKRKSSRRLHAAMNLRSPAVALRASMSPVPPGQCQAGGRRGVVTHPANIAPLILTVSS